MRTFYPQNGSSLRRKILGLLLCLSVMWIPSPANAAVTGCRGDPIVDMPNYTIQSVVEVYTDLANIERVDYVYHVPLGRVLPLMFDSSPLAAKEVATFVSSNGGGVQIDTVVTLKPGVAPVQVNLETTIKSKLTGRIVTKNATAMSGQAIIVRN